MWHISTSFHLLLLALVVALVTASSKDKPHGHKGVLEAYNGQLLPFKATSDQEKKLSKGENVSHAL